MKLWIAEKPVLAQDIAKALGVINSGNGFINCKNNNVVTWCYGHMIQSKDAEEYNPDYASWDLDKLPMQLYPLQYKPIKDKKEQLDIIGSLISKASSIVHAGDIDDEGQLLVDEVIEFFGWDNWGEKTQRVLVSDMSPKAIEKAVNNLKLNKDVKSQYFKALARTAGDFIYGLNMTRWVTVNAQKNGYGGVISIGRVQTPTLGLLTRRYQAWKNHEEQFFYELDCSIEDEKKGKINIGLINPDNLTFDEKGRAVSKAELLEIADFINGNKVIVLDSIVQSKNQYAPLPFSLVALQQEMNKSYGFTAQKTLDVTQSLRENHKCITYNRSDCSYLSEEQYEESGDLINELIKLSVFSEEKLNLEKNNKPKCFDDSKISAHTAIIPTLTIPALNALSADEEKVYLSIVSRYLAQFMPPKITEQISLKLVSGIFEFKATSNLNKSSGFASFLFPEDRDEEKSSESKSNHLIMKSLTKGDELKIVGAEVVEKKASRPKLFTEASLLNAMTRIADYVEDLEIKKLLKEKDQDSADDNGAIGTSATRSSIIENLKKRGLITLEKNNLIPSDTAIKLIESLPSVIVNPDITALWFSKQKEIEQGNLSVDDFVKSLYADINNLFEKASTTVDFENLTEKIPCPFCESNFKILPKLGVCANENCNFKVWRVVAKKKLTDPQIMELVLKGKTKEIKGFTSKADKKFSAILIINKDKKEVEFSFPEKKKTTTKKFAKKKA